ncbi:hypothetical protein BKA62DRAFT_820482 [Auriculariales sp. MPI-PUGE-AT-0066]|nr:hypothetical protein BKA62DRAFT_820482 [Auriculariales sp. MPI-PUGE-AT-0066]
MRSELVILSVVATMASAQLLDNLPPCIASCTLIAGDCSYSSLGCVCTSSGFPADIAACLMSKCSAYDQAQAIAIYQQFCATVGGSVSGSSSEFVSSSASASQSNGLGASSTSVSSTSSTIGNPGTVSGSSGSLDPTTMPVYSSHSATGTILGITIGVLALALLLVGWIVIRRRRRRNRAAHQNTVQDPGPQNKDAREISSSQSVIQGLSARDGQDQLNAYAVYGVGGLPRDAPGLEEASSTIVPATTTSSAGSKQRVLSAEETLGLDQHDPRTDAATSISGDIQTHVTGSSDVFPLDMLRPEQRTLIQSMRQHGARSDSIADAFARMLAANDQPQAQSGSGPMAAADSPPQYDFKEQRGGGS